MVKTTTHFLASAGGVSVDRHRANTLPVPCLHQGGKTRGLTAAWRWRHTWYDAPRQSAVEVASRCICLCTVPDDILAWAVSLHLWPLQECSGSFSLSGIKVQSTQMEEDVRLETLYV